MFVFPANLSISRFARSFYKFSLISSIYLYFFVSQTAVAETLAEEDPVKEAILSCFRLLQNEYGDYFVAVTAILMLLAIWKKMFRTAVGLLILILGVVLLRVLISAMF